MNESIPCVLFEDEHLLVVNKPAGLNTHAPGPYHGEGLYDWLRHREPRWAHLAIVHRLDKETSGVLVFSKTSPANRSLTEQFTRREVQKSYVLLTDRPPKKQHSKMVSILVRVGERYVSRPIHTGADRAETEFEVVEMRSSQCLVRARPLTGRTHQIRVHAADEGFPVLGDRLYGGTVAPRLMLHSEEITLKHPATNRPVRFHAPADFSSDARICLRTALIDSARTDTTRLIHGASDGWPGWYLDRLGKYLLSQAEAPLTRAQIEVLTKRLEALSLAGAYHKILRRRMAASTSERDSPQLILGEAAPEFFPIQENGIRYELSFAEGYSVGLFLDQRENRRRLLTNHVAADFALFTPGGPRREVLNVFAYTCGFSVCAARAGARTTSLDLSRKYLDWGKRNFAVNGLDPAAHNFIQGEAFDWFKRLAKRRQSFDAILLDPPTFSRSKTRGVFQAEKHFGELMAAALPLLKPNGVLFASTNAATLLPEKFIATIRAAVAGLRRRIAQSHFVPQPIDFPITRGEPGYLKTVWLRIE